MAAGISSPRIPCQYLTLLNRGFRRFAAGDAFRAPTARIFLARTVEIPCRFAICVAAALKPMPFFVAIINCLG